MIILSKYIQYLKSDFSFFENIFFYKFMLFQSKIFFLEYFDINKSYLVRRVSELQPQFQLISILNVHEWLKET